MPTHLAPNQPIPTSGHHLIVVDWPTQAESGLVTLGKEASKHLGQVLRIKVSEPLSFTNGHGHIAQGTVAEVSKNTIRVEVGKQWLQTPWPTTLTVMHALPKGKKLDEVIRRACELGVDHFYPIQTARCDRKLDTAKAEAQVERWQAIADSATEQSRRAWAMTVHSVTSMPHYTKGIILWEEATAALSTVLANHPEGDLTLLVGPEGGLTREEVEASGLTPASLGPRILRTETAGVTAAVLGSWHLGRLG